MWRKSKVIIDIKLNEVTYRPKMCITRVALDLAFFYVHFLCLSKVKL